MAQYNCLHPRLITNPHGDRILVPCGECEACTNRKSFNYTTQCKLESLSHKYCMFVTLTYSNEYLPLVSVKYHDSYWFFNPIGRLHENFIRSGRPYFAAGEYGPVHFRPHYHLLLWFDEQETLKNLRDCIHKAWTYGRIDASLSRGPAASYTSAYTNSISSRSRLHGIKYLRPFCLHSSFLFGSFYKDEVSKILEVTYADINGKCFADGDRYKSVPPILSFETKFFQRCVNYDTLNHSERLVCYSIYRKAVQEFGCRPVSQLASLIWLDSESPVHQLFKSLTFNKSFKESTLLSSLYLSRRFLEFCNGFNVSPDYYLRRIETYWSDKNYSLLVDQLTDQEEYTALFGERFAPYLLNYYGVEPLPCSDSIIEYSKPVCDYLDSIGVEPQFYTSDLFPKEKDIAFQQYSSKHKTLSRDLVKHKTLNDQNKIFL